MACFYYIAHAVVDLPACGAKKDGTKSKPPKQLSFRSPESGTSEVVGTSQKNLMGQSVPFPKERIVFITSSCLCAFKPWGM
jgi:hypothetical protein